MTLGARLIASVAASEQAAFLNSLEPEELRGLPYLFEFWAMPHQLPPDGDWKTWVVMGGRGAGKTRAGSEWVRAQVEGSGPLDAGSARRVALVGETYDQARDVMVHGESGILACSPEDRRPKWIADRRKLVWPNGAEAKVFSARDYEALRGPQFDAAWVDELAKWPKAEDAWDMLQFALRLGEHPRQVITTTPRDVPVLKRILASGSTVTTQAATRENAANLADSFLEEVEGQFAGTQLGRQELDGVLVEELEGALWTRDMLMAAGAAKEIEPDRIVVAVDPPVSSKASSDACGIVVAGVKMGASKGDWKAVVLEDASLQGATPLEWATRAVEMYTKYDADRIVAEVNQGGDLVEEMVRQVERTVSYRAVHARRGKVTRAEPVAALYEQGRVAHRRGLSALEDQMVLMLRGGFAGRGSPDRVDALVWALTDLMIKPAPEGRPRVRSLG
ncbi:MAG: DNA-packaging protein [Paracoccaceae bacterium]